MDNDQTNAPDELSVKDTLTYQFNDWLKDPTVPFDLNAGFYYYSYQQSHYCGGIMWNRVTGEEFQYSEHFWSRPLKLNFTDAVLVKYIPEGTGRDWFMAEKPSPIRNGMLESFDTCSKKVVLQHQKKIN